MIGDSVGRGASATYSLTAKAGQKAEFHLSSVEHNALFTVYLPGATLKKGDGGIDVEGETLPGADARTGASKWSGILPKDGQYIITVTPTRGGGHLHARRRGQVKIGPSLSKLSGRFCIGSRSWKPGTNLVIRSASKILNGNELEAAE